MIGEYMLFDTLSLDQGSLPLTDLCRSIRFFKEELDISARDEPIGLRLYVENQYEDLFRELMLGIKTIT